MSDVPAVSPADLTLPPPREGSKAVAARVAEARARQARRYATLPEGQRIRTNAEADGALLEEVAAPDADGRRLLTEAAEKMRLSARGYHRVLRVARTLADLEGQEAVRRVHLGGGVEAVSPPRPGAVSRSRLGIADLMRVRSSSSRIQSSCPPAADHQLPAWNPRIIQRASCVFCPGFRRRPVARQSRDRPEEFTTTGEFLLFCKSDAAGCEEEIDIIDFLLVMDEAETDYCAGSEGPDLAQTRAVMIEWLDAHPEIHGEPTSRSPTIWSGACFPAASRYPPPCCAARAKPRD